MSVTGKFSVSRFFDDVARLRPTYFSAVPAIYAMLTSQPEDSSIDTSSLRFAVCGAAPISKELLERAERRFGFVIVEGYGLTEGPVRRPAILWTACANSVRSARRCPASRLPFLPRTEPLRPPGTAGEVVIKGGNRDAWLSG